MAAVDVQQPGWAEEGDSQDESNDAEEEAYGAEESNDAGAMSHGVEAEAAYTESHAMRDVICRHCGSVLCVDGDDESVRTGSSLERASHASAATTTKQPKLKIGPKMLRLHVIRRATRVAMLAAIPGVDKRTAACIVATYPTFADIAGAGAVRLARLRVTKHTEVNADRAQAVLRAVQ
jgi:hypothetical protein